MAITLQIWDNVYVMSLQVLTMKKRNTRRVYQDSRPLSLVPSPTSLPRKVTANLFLLVKIFNLKQKSN